MSNIISSRIVTHNGPAHADDVLAVARVLSSHPGTPGIIRTRDQRVLDGAIEDSGALVLDVGGVYDPAKGAFDHHMREGGPAPRENGIGYSSFGLATRWLGLDDMEPLVLHVDATDTGFRGEIPPPPAMISALIDHVLEATGADLGGKPRSLGWLIHMCNPAHVDGSPVGAEEFDQRFIALVKLFRPCFGWDGEWLDSHPDAEALGAALVEMVSETVSAEAASRERVTALVAVTRSPVLVLDQYEGAALDVAAEGPEGLLYVVFPGPSAWMVQQVAAHPGSFEGRKGLPEAWAGLRGKELDAVTGVKEGVFCHPGRFIAGHETREGAIALASLAVEA